MGTSFAAKRGNEAHASPEAAPCEPKKETASARQRRALARESAGWWGESAVERFQPSERRRLGRGHADAGDREHEVREVVVALPILRARGVAGVRVLHGHEPGV